MSAFLIPDPEGHGGLMLAPSAREVLRGSCPLHFRRDTPSTRGRRRAADKGVVGSVIEPAARPLWDKLRAWRLDQARRQELPPYVIFHDSTLIEVARRRPDCLPALAAIPGIGRSKLERYGTALLAIVSDAV